MTAAADPCSRTLIVYFAPADVVVPRVDRQSIMRSCEGLAECGCDVELVALRVRLEFDEPTRGRDLFEVYGIDHRFRITTLPTFLSQTSGDRAVTVQRFLAQSVYATWLAFVQARRYERTVFYFKNYLVGLTFLLLRALTRRRVLLLFEIHGPAGRLGHFVLRRVDGVVAVSRRMARELAERHGVDARRIVVAVHGANLDRLERLRVSKEDARRALGLPQDRRLAVYTGKVNENYGEIDLLLEAARHFPDDTDLVLVGGREDQVARLRERAEREGRANVRFEGFVTPDDAWRYQLAGDVLLTYYPAAIPLNTYRSSPGKLFEYMASRRPIVAGDFDALREVLPAEAAVYVEPDRPAELARAVERVLAEPDVGEQIAARAYDAVRKLTPRARSERIIALLDAVAAARGPEPRVAGGRA